MKEQLSYQSQELIDALLDLYEEEGIDEDELLAEWVYPSTLILTFPAAGDIITLNVNEPSIDSNEGVSIDLSSIDVTSIYALGMEIYEQLLQIENPLRDGVQYAVIN